MRARYLFDLGILALVTFSATGCRNAGIALRKLETQKYYRTDIGGETVFFSLDAVDGRNAEGHYYSTSDGDVAARKNFSAKDRRRIILLEGNGETRKLRKSGIKWSLYVEPEFTPEDTTLFRIPRRKVKVIKDVEFGTAEGYWTSLPGVEAEVSRIFTEGYVKSFKRRKLSLTMDIYQPDDLEENRPLILFIHGGAFYVGDKQEPAYVDFCNYFASLGYVTASINYRLGFHVGKGAIERAAYSALQDANAAIRYLVANSGRYGIDTGGIYVAGSSAGSITALNLAFMTEEDRPESTYGNKRQRIRKDLGGIGESGNDLRKNFRIKAVANMWGAVSSTDMLKGGHTDVISFHGDADEVVPYAEGYPFASAGKLVSQALSEKMYGSVCIDSAARAEGLRSEMYSFAGEGHAFNTSGKDKQPNNYHTFIKEKIKDFFYTEMVPQEAAIISDGKGRYHLSTNVGSLKWKAEGGFILKSGRELEVLWREDAPDRTVTATGRHGNGIGYKTSQTIQ